MAEVQLALQRGPAGFEKLVVVKLVHDALATQKSFVDMLLDEARVAALVKHPNVVDIYDLGQADGRYFIAMEYLEGEPLLAVLRAGREGKRLDALSTGRVIADTAEGLDAAHELRSMSGERLELVHHDISLGNIVVLYNGQVKLVDFGVAKATQSAGPKSKVQGKFSYMAPEKLKGSAGDRRSDIFSLGCVMWEALTLKRLFRGGNDHETMKQVLEMAIQPPSTMNGDVPPEYDAIVMRALDRDPERRQLTAKEMAVEIEELLRKRGYGAKNDRVAKYMQETFKEHIDARKKLVQEVVSKGSASAEVLDAAFNVADGAPGAPVTPNKDSHSSSGVSDFTHYRRVTPMAGVPVPASAFADASKPTEISKSPFDVATGITQTSPPPIDLDKIDGESSEAEPLVGRAAGLKRPQIIAAGIAAVVGVVIVVVLATRGGHSHAATTGGGSGSAIVAVAVPVDAPAPPPPEPDAAAVLPSGSDVEPGLGSALHPDHNLPPTPHPPVVHPVTLTAEQQFQKALQAYVKGDAKGALGLLKGAKATNPNYAPTWRLLGQVYKKLGDRGQAKAAYQRYVTLAPNASDVAAIRKELEQP